MFTVGSVDRSIGRYSGRHSVDSRSTLGRQSVDSRSIVGRDTVDSRSRCVSADYYSFSFTDTSPTLRRHFADSWLIVGRYLTDVSVSNWSTLGQ